VRVEYEPGADSAYIYLREPREGDVVEDIPVEHPRLRAHVVVDIDQEGLLHGITVVHASRALPKELLDGAHRI
jgi:uncharacterized protein YuzE